MFSSSPVCESQQVTHLFDFVSSFTSTRVLVSAVSDVSVDVMLRGFVGTLMMAVAVFMVGHGDWDDGNFVNLLQLWLLKEINIQLGANLFLQSNFVEIIRVAVAIDWRRRNKNLWARLLEFVVRLNHTVCATEIGQQEKSKKHNHQERNENKKN